MTEDQLGYAMLRMQIRNEHDIVTARQKTRHAAELLGFKSQDQSRLATAVSELARNIYQYASVGRIEYWFNLNEPQMLFIRAIDQGPGIADLDRVLSGNYKSETGMGIGLLGARKLMDVFEVDPGRGTTVTIGKRLPSTTRQIRKEDLSSVAGQIASQQPGTPFQEIQRQNGELMRTLDELRASQDELRELNRELTETNRGVVALYAELDERAAALKTVNEIKTSFLNNITHELRTPLSSIISLTSILQMHVDGDLTDEQERQVEYIRRSAENLLELVGNLLDVAKVEAGKVTVSAGKFEMEELMGGLRGMFRPILAETENLDFTVDWDPQLSTLETDQGKISQVLRNLVSNAIKFTEKGRIAVHAVPKGEDGIHFKVTDTGIGVGPEHLNLIFEEFGQVESISPRHKGTGLGLALSRRLARLLGGDLWIESQLGTGSIFHFEIPRRYGGQSEVILFTSGESAAPNPAKSEQSLFDVLIVDEDEVSRSRIQKLLKMEIDATFVEAKSGREGLDLLAAAIPDLIILELNLSDIDGFEVLSAIKNGVHAKDVPVILNTARALSLSESEYLRGTTTAGILKKLGDDQVTREDLKRALAKAGFNYKSR